MRKVLFATVAAAALSAVASSVERAKATPFAAPLSSIAATSATPVEKVTVVCGNGGCGVVQTKRVQHHQLPKSIR